jgi:hypothetical protein
MVSNPVNSSRRLPLKQIGKNCARTLVSEGVLPMFGTHTIEAATFTVLYRGYDIEVSRAPSGWRAGVYPRTPDLPILRRSEVHACDQDEAVIEAMDRVDGALRHANITTSPNRRGA